MLYLPYNGEIRDYNGNNVLPVKASQINVSNPDLTCGIIRVYMNSGVIAILSANGNGLTAAYTGRKISVNGNTETIISSGSFSVSGYDAVTLGTLVNRGDTLIIDNFYEANSSHVYRITVMVTWSSLPYGGIIIERIA